MNLNYLLGGDLNPVSEFCFPLFSMVLPRKLPSVWKTVEGTGSKIAANCKSTYVFLVSFMLRSLKFSPSPREQLQALPLSQPVELLWLYRFERAAYDEWVVLEEAKIKKFAERTATGHAQSSRH